MLGLVLTLLTPLTLQGQTIDGLASKITSISMGADRRRVVTFTVNDGRGKTVELAALDPGGVKFTIAALRSTSSGSSEFHNYLLSKVSGKEFAFKGETKKPALVGTWQPDIDQDGALKQLRPGVFNYTFKSALPANIDGGAAHVVGGVVTAANGKLVANPVFEFVPSGAKSKVQSPSVETVSCNSCHDPLQAHGGAVREVRTCVLCHTAQLTDPESGESLDFKVLAHKIHRGKLLPSVKAGRPFFVVGAAQQVKDYSTIRYPQIVVSSGAHLELRNCQACHAKPDNDRCRNYSQVNVST